MSVTSDVSSLSSVTAPSSRHTRTYNSPSRQPHRLTLSTASTDTTGTTVSTANTDVLATPVELCARYETILGQLARQALAQQEEIDRLKAQLAESAGRTSSAQKQPPQPATDGTAAAATMREAVIQRVTESIAQEYLNASDAYLAECMARRLRRITQAHVRKSIDNAVAKEACSAHGMRRVSCEHETPGDRHHDASPATAAVTTKERDLPPLAPRRAAHDEASPFQGDTVGTVSASPVASPDVSVIEQTQSLASASTPTSPHSVNAAPMSNHAEEGNAQASSDKNDAATHRCRHTSWASTTVSATTESSTFDAMEYLLNVFSGLASTPTASASGSSSRSGSRGGRTPTPSRQHAPADEALLARQQQLHKSPREAATTYSSLSNDVTRSFTVGKSERTGGGGLSQKDSPLSPYPASTWLGNEPWPPRGAIGSSGTARALFTEPTPRAPIDELDYLISAFSKH